MILYSSCNFEHCVETGMSSKKWLHFWVKIPKIDDFRSNRHEKQKFGSTQSNYGLS